MPKFPKFPKFVQLGKLDSIDEFGGEGVVDVRLVGAGRVGESVTVKCSDRVNSEPGCFMQ